MKKIFLILLMLSILTARIYADNQSNLELTIHCPKNDLKVGDEIPIVFTITNKERQSYFYTDRKGDRSGRMREYQLVAKDEKGNTVPDPRRNYEFGIGGGLSSSDRYLQYGESFTKVIVLNRWALIKEPGRYVVTGTYFSEDQVKISSQAIEVVVKQRSNEEMGEYINKLISELNTIKMTPRAEVDKLEKKIWADKFDRDAYEKYQKIANKRCDLEKRKEILKKMMYTCDKRIVPALIDLMYKNFTESEVFWAKEAFRFYLPKDPEIKKTVLGTAKKRGLAPGMQSVLENYDCGEDELKDVISTSLASTNPYVMGAGVIAAQEHPHDEYTPRLISIATNPDEESITRSRAIYAIAFNRTDEGVEALKNLLENPDESVRQTTARAINQAYKRQAIKTYKGRPLKKDDFGNEFRGNY